MFTTGARLCHGGWATRLTQQRIRDTVWFANWAKRGGQEIAAMVGMPFNDGYYVDLKHSPEGCR